MSIIVVTQVQRELRDYVVSLRMHEIVSILIRLNMFIEDTITIIPDNEMDPKEN